MIPEQGRRELRLDAKRDLADLQVEKGWGAEGYDVTHPTPQAVSSNSHLVVPRDTTVDKTPSAIRGQSSL